MVFVSCQFYLALFTVNSGSFSILRSICLFLNLAIHFSENLGIFRVALLFICQRSVILRCCCSQRQLWYLIITAFVCQQLFLKSLSSWKTLFSVTGIYVNISVRLCQQLFWNLFKFLSSCCVVSALPQQRIWVYHPLVYWAALCYEFFTQIIPCRSNSAYTGDFNHVSIMFIAILQR